MASLEADSQEKQEMDDSGCIQDETPPYKRWENGTARGIQLLDLSDDVLLLILRFLAPRDLRALGYTCPRLGSLSMDRSLWQCVDAREQPWTRARLRWYLLHALHAGTRKLLLSGYAREARECLGHVNQTREEIEAAKVAGIEPSNGNDGSDGNASDGNEDNNNTEQQDMDVDGDRRPNGAVQQSRVIPVPSLGPNAQLYIDESRELREEAWAWPRPSDPLVSDATCPGPQFTLTRCVLRQLAHTCPALSTLHLEYCNINCNVTNISQFPTTLKELSLRGSKCYNLQLDRSFLFKIQGTLPNLEVLDVSECEWMEPASLLPLSKLTTLKRLFARDCLRLTEFVAYASLATRYGFTGLEWLDLRGSPVGDSEVSALGWLPRLARLWLSPARAPPPPARAPPPPARAPPPPARAPPPPARAPPPPARAPPPPARAPPPPARAPPPPARAPPPPRAPHSHRARDRLPRAAPRPGDLWENEEPVYYKIKEPLDCSELHKKYADLCDEDDSKHTWRAGDKADISGTVRNTTTHSPWTPISPSSSNLAPSPPKAHPIGPNPGPTNGQTPTKSKDPTPNIITFSSNALAPQTSKASPKGHSSKVIPLCPSSPAKSPSNSTSDTSEASPTSSKTPRKSPLKDSRTSNTLLKGSSKSNTPSQGCSILKITAKDSSISDSPVKPTLSNLPTPSKAGSNGAFPNGPSTSRGSNGSPKAPKRRRSPSPGPSKRKRNDSDSSDDDDVPLKCLVKKNSVNEGASTSMEPKQQEAQEDIEAEPRHHVLYVNVGQQLHAVYRLSLDNDHMVSFSRNNAYDFSHHLSHPGSHIDASSLITDSAIRRFGRADGEDINYVHIGPNGAYPANNAPGMRPDRSSLTHLSVTGFRHITDRSLDHLTTSAPNLQFLDLSESSVTMDGVVAFTSARPECRLVHTARKPPVEAEPEPSDDI